MGALSTPEPAVLSRRKWLKVAGLGAAALAIGQVDELMLTADPTVLDDRPERSAGNGSGRAGGPTSAERTADELIRQARLTSASIRFIEDGSLLAAVNGVGALLRYKL